MFRSIYSCINLPKSPLPKKGCNTKPFFCSRGNYPRNISPNLLREEKDIAIEKKHPTKVSLSSTNGVLHTYISSIFERTGQDWLRAWKVIARCEIPRRGSGYAICPYTWPRCSFVLRPSWSARFRELFPPPPSLSFSLSLSLSEKKIVHIVVKIKPRTFEIIRAAYDAVRMPIKSYKRNCRRCIIGRGIYWTKIEKTSSRILTVEKRCNVFVTGGDRARVSPCWSRVCF